MFNFFKESIGDNIIIFCKYNNSVGNPETNLKWFLNEQMTTN